MERLTVQAFLDNGWRDIAQILFPDGERQVYTITGLEYDSGYAVEYLFRDDHHAVSLNYPVQLFFDDGGSPGWMRFLDDIMPAGASRRYWLKWLDIEGLTPDQQNYVLLRYGAISPVGNLRIKESLPVKSAEKPLFTVADVKERAADFLDYAQQRGAAAGGATGAGGEAPKLLLRCNRENRVWIDTWQDEPDNQDLYYLVKFPCGRRSEVDNNILRAEFHYYHELTAMGFDTIPIANMRLEEGSHYPSLWLPRFDIADTENGGVKRYAMESVYSLLNKGPGAALFHDETIRALIDKIAASHTVAEQGGTFDARAFVIEWVRRDLLNIVFGNSDNHGRNTSLLRDERGIRLAPIYDFAPMKADPEGIPRSTRWPREVETGGDYDFVGIAALLDELVPGETLLTALRATARQLLSLKARLGERGVPEQILSMPSIGFDYIADKLTRWGLLP